DIRATELEGNALRGLTFTLNANGEQIRIQLHLPGEHGITIALAAAATGIAADIPLEEIRIALEELVPAKRRGEIKRGPNNSTLIDDSYNASRQSILAIAQTMHKTQIEPSGKRWAVLGDILELGTHAREEHALTGAALARLVDYIIAIGDQARFYVEGALEAGMPIDHVTYFAADI